MLAATDWLQPSVAEFARNRHGLLNPGMKMQGFKNGPQHDHAPHS
jgi:hypothetical protein